jgi:hypothetical protein
VVRPEGIEPPTPCFVGKCSNPLNYGREIDQPREAVAELVQAPSKNAKVRPV